MKQKLASRSASPAPRNLAEIDETAHNLTKFSFRDLEFRNLALTKLHIKSVSIGMYGKILVALERRTKNIVSDEKRQKLK